MRVKGSSDWTTTHWMCSECELFEYGRQCSDYRHGGVRLSYFWAQVRISIVLSVVFCTTQITGRMQLRTFFENHESLSLFLSCTTCRVTTSTALIRLDNLENHGTRRNNSNPFIIYSWWNNNRSTYVVWRGDLQKPQGLYKGGHLMIGDYLLSYFIICLYYFFIWIIKQDYLHLISITTAWFQKWSEIIYS